MRLIDQRLADAVISPYPAYETYLCQSDTNQFYYKEMPDQRFTTHHYANFSDEDVRHALHASIVEQLAQPDSPFHRYASKPDLSVCNKTIRNVDDPQSTSLL